MDRASIYFLDNADQNTYDFDEALPPLPLPELQDTLQRYYESLKPFGTEEELAESRRSIAAFKDGIGARLHAKLKERAARMKNWLDGWWEAYAYHLLRMPLNPYIVMAMPVNLQSIEVEESPQTLLTNLARITYHTIEYWSLLHQGKVKPLSSGGGKVKYSSAQYKRFYSATRVPGVDVDHIEQHFRTSKEGATPTHGLISGKGRLFVFDCVHQDQTILSPQEILVLLQRVRTMLDYEPTGDCVPVLTHDDRSTWAKNRQHLREISAGNRETLHLVESSSIVLAFDEHEPRNYEEISQVCVNGDFHSKWGDRSSIVVAYRNGKFAFVGEHSAYDGTVSVSYAIFIKLSLFEEPTPDWTDTKAATVVPLRELRFDLDEPLRGEIRRVLEECDRRRTDVIITHAYFEDYGKDYIKSRKLHPDSFLQVVMQLAYLRMHKEVAATYETALMRHFYNGRTETLRSCTGEVHRFLQTAMNPAATKAEIVKSFCDAVAHHNHMMNEARQGRGIDRHLFGLWCIAYEENIETPEFYADALYARSGGGGNFRLSSSTLGYTSVVGFVAPMLLDGYGVFYSIVGQGLYIQVSAFRGSTETSAHKFSAMFEDSLRWMKSLLDEVQNAKL